MAAILRSQICRAHKHYEAILSVAFKLFNLQFPRRSLKLLHCFRCCFCFCFRCCHWLLLLLLLMLYLFIFIDSIIFYLLYWIHVIVLPRPVQSGQVKFGASLWSGSGSPNCQWHVLSGLGCVFVPLLSSQHIKQPAKGGPSPKYTHTATAEKSVHQGFGFLGVPLEIVIIQRLTSRVSD